MAKATVKINEPAFDTFSTPNTLPTQHGGGQKWRGGARIGLILLGLAPIILVVSFLWNDARGTSPRARLLSPGMAAPDFELPAQDGRPFHLADYRGRAVFVAFVPSWTDAKTVAEVRSLKAATEQFDAAGAKVMLVSSDTTQKAQALYARERLPFPLLTDAGGSLAKQYSVQQATARTTFVVDPAGGVKFRVGDATVETARHGQQLLDVSKCCVDEVTAARAHGIGKAVGDYSLPRADGSGMETLMGSAEAAKATVVLFLSVKCPCSNAYNDRVADLARVNKPKGVRIIGVYANRNESAAEIMAHAKAHGFSFPILRDERALCADHLGASITPEAFVIDAKHVLRYAGRIDGSRNPAEAKTQELQDAMTALLSGQPVKSGDTHAFGCSIVR